MAKKICIVLLLFSLSGCGIFRDYRITRLPQEIKIQLPNKTLVMGEKLTYKAEWLGLNVGIATLSVEGIVDINGRKAYQIVAIVNTTPVISKLYKVEDRIRTFIDTEALYPLRLEKKQREGGNKKDEYIEFDHEKGKATCFNNIDKTEKTIDIPPGAQDPLSCLYYFRLKEVDMKGRVFANVNADEKNYLLDANVLKRAFLKIKDVGEWDAFMVEPLPWFQGKVQRKARAMMWFSIDEKRIPLVMSIKSIPLVGNVTITLQKIEYIDKISNEASPVTKSHVLAND